MTRDDIIRMAREAGEVKCDCCLPSYEETDIEGFEGFLERFAALVAAAERETFVKDTRDEEIALLREEIKRLRFCISEGMLRQRWNT
jgi:hypothetical protein